jgi:hypothetical protein
MKADEPPFLRKKQRAETRRSTLSKRLDNKHMVCYDLE